MQMPSEAKRDQNDKASIGQENGTRPQSRFGADSLSVSHSARSFEKVESSGPPRATTQPASPQQAGLWRIELNWRGATVLSIAKLAAGRLEC
jgi:hypothetical protein